MKHSNTAKAEKHLRQIPRATILKQPTSLDLVRNVNAVNVNATRTASLKSVAGDGILIKTQLKPSNIMRYPRKILKRSYCLCAFKRPTRMRLKPAKKLTLYVSSKWDTGSKINTAKFSSSALQTREQPTNPALRILIWLLCCFWHSLPLVVIGTWLGNYFYGYAPALNKPTISYNTWTQLFKQFNTHNQANDGTADIRSMNGLILVCLLALSIIFKSISKF